MIIRYVIWFLILILCTYFHWYLIANEALPKKYNEFMEFVIKERIFDNSSFYSQSQIENDYKKRILPIFDEDEVDFIEFGCSFKSETVDYEKITKIIKEYLHLKRAYLSRNIELKKRGFNITGIPSYTNIHKKINISLAIILGLLILSDVFIMKPMVTAEISEPEKRHIVSNETIETEAEILEKTYKSRFFGSEKYEFRIKLNELEEIIEVDPFIYQKKK